MSNLEQLKEEVKDLTAEEQQELRAYLNCLLDESEESQTMTAEERAAKFKAAADEVFAHRSDLLRRLAE